MLFAVIFTNCNFSHVRKIPILEEKFTHLQSFFNFLKLNNHAITKQYYENDWSFEESILRELDPLHISLTHLMYDLSRCEKRSINAIVDQLALDLDLHASNIKIKLK